MTITLYSFTKKSNSTARPGPLVSKKVFNNAYLKNASSLITPMLQLAKDSDPTGYNYCYVDEWNRYYFITDIVYALGVWQLSLRVDVLATYRSEIFGSSQYILRSASSNDQDISDDYYTTKSLSSGNYYKNDMGQVYATDISPLPEPVSFFDVGYTSGQFIVGVIGGNDTGMTYYSMSYSKFAAFVSAMMATVPSDMTDVSSGVAKSLYDPVQYITMCKWYPIGPTPTSAASSINFGGYAVNVGSNVGSFSNGRKTVLSGEITVPKHPQITSHGNYLQLQPYSRYGLMFEPFGDLTLDNTVLYGCTTVTCEWILDYATGQSELRIFNKDTGALLGSASANLGVDIPISQLTVDYVGGTLGTIGSVAGIVGNGLAGNIAGMFGSFAAGIGNAATSFTPKLASTGSQGSFIPYSVGKPFIYLQTVDQVDKDVARYGSPLCQVKTLSTLSGFCMTANAAIEIDGLDSENEEICSLLNSGVYLE